MTDSATGTRRTSRWNATRSAPLTGRSNCGFRIAVVVRTTSYSSSSGGCSMTMWNMKRSSWASGSGIGAFELDRVLRGEHEERLFERIRAALHGHAVLLHGFEQRRLRLGRRAVDFVGQDDVREDRAGREHHLAPAGRRILLDDVGAGDVGRHQVGRELDAVELEVEHARHRMDEQRLGEARARRRSGCCRRRTASAAPVRRPRPGR